MIVGYSIAGIAGLLLFIFWLIAMTKWLGFIGTILAFIGVPGVLIFPVVYWIVEGVFPTFYFILWGISAIGMIIVAIFFYSKKSFLSEIKSDFKEPLGVSYSDKNRID